LSEQSFTNQGCQQDREKIKAALDLVVAYSHEISEHTTVIMGNSEIIYDHVPRTDQAVRKHVDEIVRSARQIATATRKLFSLRDHCGLRR